MNIISLTCLLHTSSQLLHYSQFLILIKMSASRSISYSHAEDQHLCRVYLDISQNPIVGINQTKDKFWKRIAIAYHAIEPFASQERPLRSLESRMGAILKATSFFRACVNQIENRNPSGASEQDIVSTYYYCSYLIVCIHILLSDMYFFV